MDTIQRKQALYRVCYLTSLLHCSELWPLLIHITAKSMFHSCWAASCAIILVLVPCTPLMWLLGFHIAAKWVNLWASTRQSSSKSSWGLQSFHNITSSWHSAFHAIKHVNRKLQCTAQPINSLQKSLHSHCNLQLQSFPSHSSSLRKRNDDFHFSCFTPGVSSIPHCK